MFAVVFHLFLLKKSSILPPAMKKTTIAITSPQNVNLSKLKFVPSLSGSKKSEIKDFPPNKNLIGSQQPFQ